MSDAVKAVSFAADASAKGALRGTITPIRSKEHPTFSSLKILTAPGGPETLALVEEIRHTLKPLEPQLFAWLQAPGNAEAYAKNPAASLKKAGVTVDAETMAKIERLGELLKASHGHAGKEK